MRAIWSGLVFAMSNSEPYSSRFVFGQSISAVAHLDGGFEALDLLLVRAFFVAWARHLSFPRPCGPPRSGGFIAVGWLRRARSSCARVSRHASMLLRLSAH
jgi:hypothetical protein